MLILTVAMFTTLFGAKTPFPLDMPFLQPFIQAAGRVAARLNGALAGQSNPLTLGAGELELSALIGLAVGSGIVLMIGLYAYIRWKARR